MAVTVKKAWTERPFVWHTDKDGSHALMFSNSLFLKIQKDGETFDCKVTFCGRDDAPGSRCFKCDGLSVPSPFQWFLDDWDDDNPLYNLAGALHDWLYATRGAYMMFSRSECDDIFRGILREAGVGRFRAGMADYFVGVFGGGSCHWNNDDFDIGEMVSLKILERADSGGTR